MLAIQETEKPTQTAAKPSPSMLGLIQYSRVCGLLNITRPTLDKMANDPTEHFPKRVMFGKTFYVRLSDLKRWIDQKYGG
jgi:predicted DNA-binding transcriptional regulator AlpA